MTRFNKRFGIGAMVLIAVGFVVSALGGQQLNPRDYAMGGVLLLVAGGGFFLFERQLADEVQDLGDALLVMRGDLQKRFSLAEVECIDRRGFGNGRYFTLRLRKAEPFGERINFRPARGIGEPEREELNQRIANARGPR